MFVALRDLRAARGRFVLITTVVMLVAVLVSFLSGLTAGLAHQNVSAVERITADELVFADTGNGASFSESVVTAQQADQWRQVAAGVVPIGVSRGSAAPVTAAGPGVARPVALIGADAGVSGDVLPSFAGSVVLSEGAATEIGAAAGSAIMVGGNRFDVQAIRGDDWYSHSPVIWLTLADWQNLAGGDTSTVLAVTGVTTAPGTATLTIPGTDGASAISSFTAENGSLTLMTAMLLAISALVIGAFFTVWTLQRTPDVAVLKALGSSTGALVRDALGQALIVLGVGVGVGVGLTVVGSRLLGDALPFVLDASTTLIPAAALIGLGLLGAAFALRFLSTTDPLKALGSNR